MRRAEQRAAVTHLIYERLADPAFQQTLIATDAEGNAPILVALPSDPVHRLLRDVARVGGSANVATPYRNGIIVYTVEAEPGAAGGRGRSADLDAGCTVGVLLERLHLDGDEATYRFAVALPDHTRGVGRAEVVAVAG